MQSCTPTCELFSLTKHLIYGFIQLFSLTVTDHLLLFTMHSPFSSHFQLLFIIFLSTFDSPLHLRFSLIMPYSTFLLELADDAFHAYSTPWDSDKIVGCVCDLGFRGVDCSQIECPSGIT